MGRSVLALSTRVSLVSRWNITKENWSWRSASISRNVKLQNGVFDVKK
jgi:hypothetical protein